MLSPAASTLQTGTCRQAGPLLTAPVKGEIASAHAARALDEGLVILLALWLKVGGIDWLRATTELWRATTAILYGSLFIAVGLQAVAKTFEATLQQLAPRIPVVYPRYP